MLRELGICLRLVAYGQAQDLRCIKYVASAGPRGRWLEQLLSGGSCPKSIWPSFCFSFPMAFLESPAITLTNAILVLAQEISKAG